MSLALGTRLGIYEIVSAIGIGGMGEVYRATDTALGRQVAIKVLPESVATDPDRLARFEREAKTLAVLNHPNIAQIYGLERSGGTQAIVMELVEGETLADRIARGPIPIVDEALPIAKQIAEALEAAHEQGVIHRDLKPANIKVRPDGAVKVLDFGLAKLSELSGTVRTPDLSLSPTITSPAMTGVGVLLGTAAYMAPEQAKGRPADKRSDIWAFGCVLYEMVTGQRAFEGDDISDTIAVILRGEPDWSALRRRASSSVDALLRRCVNKDARKRWQAAGDLRVEIESILAGSERVDSETKTASGPRAWWKSVALVTLGIVAGAALTAGIMWARRPSTAPTTLTRFSFGLREGGFSGATKRVIAISRDGANIVYAANNQLYLRRNDDLEARPIPGSNMQGVSGPFFSPDGQWIGFTPRDGTLRKIPVSGGAPVTLCAVPSFFGGSWEGDTVVFADEGKGVFSVSAGGGTPTLWVKASPGELIEGPQMLPGGQAVMFNTTTAPPGAQRWDQGDVVVASREGARRVLIHGGSSARYVEPNHIVYAVGRNLLAVPFDLTRLEVTGGAVPVLQGVTRADQGQTGASGAANFDVSALGTLVYIPGTAMTPPSTRNLVWVDRRGREEPLNVPVRDFTDPHLSPDEHHLLVTASIDENIDVWSLDLSRGTFTRQTFDAGEDETPVWSPDGKWVAYASLRGSERIVFRRRADGSGAEEPLWRAQLPWHFHVQDWTGTGRGLVVATDDIGVAQFDLAMLADGARTLKPLLRSPFNEQGARVSPDGRWMAYSSDESGRDEVYVQTFPSMEGKWQISTSGGSQPVWSRRGDELFFRGGGSLMVVHVSAAHTFSAGEPQKLFGDQHVGGANHTGYDVSADGQRFLMIKEETTNAPVRPTEIVVAQHWSEELRRLVPAK